MFNILSEDVGVLPNEFVQFTGNVYKLAVPVVTGLVWKSVSAFCWAV